MAIGDSQSILDTKLTTSFSYRLPTTVPGSVSVGQQVELGIGLTDFTVSLTEKDGILLYGNAGVQFSLKGWFQGKPFSPVAGSGIAAPIPVKGGLLWIDTEYDLYSREIGVGTKLSAWKFLEIGVGIETPDKYLFPKLPESEFSLERNYKPDYRLPFDTPFEFTHPALDFPDPKFVGGLPNFGFGPGVIPQNGRDPFEDRGGPTGPMSQPPVKPVGPYPGSILIPGGGVVQTGPLTPTAITLPHTPSANGAIGGLSPGERALAYAGPDPEGPYVGSGATWLGGVYQNGPLVTQPPVIATAPPGHTTGGGSNNWGITPSTARKRRKHQGRGTGLQRTTWFPRRMCCPDIWRLHSSGH